MSKILDICSQYGIEVQLTSHRFRFKECPFCGSEKWKVWLYENNANGSVAGSCFRCGQKFSLYSLLLKYDLPADVLGQVCFQNNNVEWDTEKDVPILDLNNGEIVEPGQTEKQKLELELASWRYWGIEERLEHPASQYAISRGVIPALYPEIKIDIQTNAVVFLIKDSGGNLIGYQSRYVEPKTENKTYTYAGLKVANSLLRYFHSSGDIFLCEGPFNAVTAYNWGHTALCTFGSKISDWQLKEIRNIARKLNKKICCAFDDDEPGIKAYLTVKEVCSCYGLDVLRIKPENNENDINDAWKKGLGFEVIEDKNTSLFHFLPEL